MLIFIYLVILSLTIAQELLDLISKYRVIRSYYRSRSRPTFMSRYIITAHGWVVVMHFVRVTGRMMVEHNNITIFTYETGKASLFTLSWRKPGKRVFNIYLRESNVAWQNQILVSTRRDGRLWELGIAGGEGSVGRW